MIVVLALTVDSAKNLAMVITIALVLAAFVALWTITQVTRKLVTALLIGVLALGVWTQRADLVDCGRNLEKRIELGADRAGSCKFFGGRVSL